MNFINIHMEKWLQKDCQLLLQIKAINYNHQIFYLGIWLEISDLLW